VIIDWVVLNWLFVVTYLLAAASNTAFRIEADEDGVNALFLGIIWPVHSVRRVLRWAGNALIYLSR